MTRQPRTPKPKGQPDCERLLVHGLKVSNVINGTIHWDRPPTESEKNFAAELLEKEVSHSHA